MRALCHWRLPLPSLALDVGALWAPLMFLSAFSDCGTPLMATLLTVPQLLDAAATRVVLWPVYVPAAPLRCDSGRLSC